MCLCSNNRGCTSNWSYRNKVTFNWSGALKFTFWCKKLILSFHFTILCMYFLIWILKVGSISKKCRTTTYTSIFACLFCLIEQPREYSAPTLTSKNPQRILKGNGDVRTKAAEKENVSKVGIFFFSLRSCDGQVLPPQWNSHHTEWSFQFPAEAEYHDAQHEFIGIIILEKRNS